jgi:hypothetical protein
MAIFGTIDAKALATNVSVTNGSTTVTTTGDFTNRATADFVQNGDVLSLGGVQYTVESVVSATSLKLRTAYAGSTGTVLAANAIRRTAPKEVATLLLDENGQLAHFPTGTSLIFIDDTEAALDENKVRGLKWPGWWAYRTYTDGDGNTRHKAECIAFANQTAANAGDYGTAQGGTEDNPAADVTSTISISGQPSNQSTFGPAGAIRTVTRAGTAAAGTGTYTITGSTAGNVITNVSGGAAPAANGYEFTVSRSGGTYTVTVVTGGSGFAATDTILVKGSQLGGVDTTNDLTITVATVASGAATFSVTASVGTGTLTYQWQVQAATSTTRWTNVTGATSSSLALTGLTTADNGKKYRVKVGGSAGGAEVISSTATLTVTAA